MIIKAIIIIIIIYVMVDISHNNWICMYELVGCIAWDHGPESLLWDVCYPILLVQNFLDLDMGDRVDSMC